MSERSLPTGTVTLLLADVEGSTRLWEADQRTMAVATALLDQRLSEILSVHDGVRPIEQGEGDSFVAAFTRASDAVATALDLQRAQTAPIRLRIGVHTGDVQLRDEGNYVGHAINRTARLRDIGHGGQTLLSQATRDLVVDHLPEGASLLDMGEHRLRDLTRREHVWQLCTPDLESRFPPLRSLDAYPQNLPVQLTPFIGRQHELAELRSLVADTRLLTLTGSGGAGKTRLALELAADLVTDHPDGTWWVELAPVTDAAFVASTTARTLGLPDEVGRMAIDTIERHLTDKQLLILLDNCEHLIAECVGMTDHLLRRCPGLTIVATSREPLALAGETTYRVPSLSLTRVDGGASEAVQLFVDRARRARPVFELTTENSTAVDEICQTLDGLPLALELAAARLRALSLRQIADGLEDRFRLLTTGSSAVVPRQQTLRASVDWSHHLLTDAERVLFRRVAVFAGTFTLEAALTVGASDALGPHHVFDLLALLVDKSLVVLDDSRDPPRYRLLETVRQYAIERLSASAEELDIRRAHRDFFLARASELPLLVDTEDLELAVVELDNFRAAIRWSVDNEEVEAAVRLINGLSAIWNRGRVSEGRAWYDVVLPRSDELHPAVRSWALGLSATLDVLAQDHAAIGKADECVAVTRALGDRAGVALALANLSTTRMHLEGRVDRDSVADYVAASRESGNPQVLAWALYQAALTLLNAGDLAAAAALADECLEVSTGLTGGFSRGAKTVRAMTLAGRGEPLQALGALNGLLDEARRWHDNLPVVLATLGWAHALTGATDEGARLCDEAITIADEYGQPLNREWARSLRGIASLAAGDAPTARQHLRDLTGTFIERSTYLAEALLADGDAAEARRVADETIALSRSQSSAAALSRALAARARVAIAVGELRDAEQLAHEALRLRVELRDRGTTADILEVLAAVARDDIACRLLGAAATLRTESGTVRFKIYDGWHASLVAALREELGSEAFDRLWTEGGALSLEEVTAYAQRGRGPRRRVSSGWSSLTPSELNVARLVAEGVTNRDIAARLFISPRTVQAHLTHIYAKLDLSSRVQLAREALKRS